MSLSPLHTHLHRRVKSKHNPLLAFATLLLLTFLLVTNCSLDIYTSQHPPTTPHSPKAAILANGSSSFELESPVHVLGSPKDAILGRGLSPSSRVEVVKMQGGCDLYSGKWVREEQGRYPLYFPGKCPYVDGKFDCYSHGRRDAGYLKWRWKPHGCDLPRFNATEFLERLRGKVLMVVGDSMGRNQYESLLCLLHEPFRNKTHEAIDYTITKDRSYFRMLFIEYNCSVEYHRSYYLVRQGTRIDKSGKIGSTLQIDQIDNFAWRWKRADVLIFNSGHWWTPAKTNFGKNFYQERGVVYRHLDDKRAFERSLRTWATWVEKNLKPKKNLVFLRALEVAHFRGGSWRSGGKCDGEVEPAFEGRVLDEYPWQMKAIEQVIRRMRFPVHLLNVTRLTNFRKDAHPSIYGRASTLLGRRPTTIQDCSHWCLPGVPDAWNELLYAHLLI